MHTSIAQTRRLCQEHDHRSSTNGWSDLGLWCNRRSNATNTRTYSFLSRQVGVPYVVVFLNKADLLAEDEVLVLKNMKKCSN